jgi:hypothetical protein
MHEESKMRKILIFAAVLMFVSSTAYAGMGINVSKFSLDGMGGSDSVGIHYDLNDTSAVRVNLGIANAPDDDGKSAMFKDIDLRVAYRMFKAKSSAVRPFMQGHLSVDNVTGDDMNLGLGAGIGGEWFYNENISLELSTGLSFGMATTPGTPAVAAVGATPAVPEVKSETTNSVSSWTTGVGFNLYW